MFARGNPIGATAGRGGGQRHNVDVACGSQHKEVRIGAVKKTKVMVESSNDPVSHGLGGLESSKVKTGTAGWG